MGLPPRRARTRRSGRCANSASAPDPATGRSAWAASEAEVSGPFPPIAAAVAMMIVIEMTQAKSAPEIASIRARG